MEINIEDDYLEHDIYGLLYLREFKLEWNLIDDTFCIGSEDNINFVSLRIKML